MLRRRSSRIVLLSSLGAGFLVFAYFLRSVFNPFLLALLLAYALNPLVSFLERRGGVPRPLTICFVYVVLGALMVATVVVIVPTVSNEAYLLGCSTFIGDKFNPLDDRNRNGQWDEGERIEDDINRNRRFDRAYIEEGEVWLQARIQKWNTEHEDHRVEWGPLLEDLKRRLAENAQQVIQGGVDATGQVVTVLSSGISGLFTLFSYAVLVPIYLFFLLNGMDRMWRTIDRHLPGRHRASVLDVLGKVHRATSAFFRGKLIICLVKGLITFLGLALLDVRFALVFGLVQMVASLVPFLVLVLGLAPALIVTLMDHGIGPGTLIGVCAVFAIAEFLEGMVLTPYILGKETGLHPVSLILSLILGGKLFGFFGVLLAVPFVSILKILGEEYVLPELRFLAQEKPASAETDG